MHSRLLSVLFGMAGALLACELVLQALPVSSATARDYYMDPQVLSYPPGHRWHMATGWDLRNAQTLRANNFGFASEIDFVPDPQAVAFIGDSYVEASMLGAADRPGAQLARALKDERAVYALGAPGSALLDYAERIRLASTRLAVRDFVILMEAGDVRQSLCGSGNVHGPCLAPRKLEPRVETFAPASTLKRLISKSALAQYLVGQLKLDVRRLPAQLFAADAPTHEPASKAASAEPAVNADTHRAEREAMVRAVSTAFFDRVQTHQVRKLVIVVDGQRKAVSLDADPQAAQISLERGQFMEIARARGAVVIDAEALYREHWKTSMLSLDVGPYDGHLNALGVRLVAQAAAAAIR
ncbi:MAG: hypothetical protein IPO19_00210 [Rhodoferax sp.]|nr:hypothetical protein [Rhodoferax sp.]